MHKPQLDFFGQEFGINNTQYNTPSIAGKFIFTFSISLKCEQSLLGASQHTILLSQAQMFTDYLSVSFQSSLFKNA
jgi:hypothetical protein